MDKATVEIPIEFTLSAMDEGGVSKGLLSASFIRGTIARCW